MAGPDLSTTSLTAHRPLTDAAARRAPLLAALAVFGVLFAPTAASLVQQWWSDPDAGHGLLLVPVALWLAWRAGVDPAARANPGLGVLLIVLAVMFRLAGSLAAELFSQRLAMLTAAAGLVTFFVGWRQLRSWWLPAGLVALSIPLPTVVLNELALPLQLRASRIGAALLAMRDVPVVLAGNVINLPGHQLFVTEACSGLRSLTALLSLGLLLGGLWLGRPCLRLLVLGLSVMVAIGVNGVRVFLTGFLVYYVSPAAGEGFLHTTKGWLLFIVSLGVLGLATWALRILEVRTGPEATHA